MQLFERLCTTFFTHNAPLVSDGGYYSSEDVFTALPYAKGRRYFDAVALHIHRIIAEFLRKMAIFATWQTISVVIAFDNLQLIPSQSTDNFRQNRVLLIDLCIACYRKFHA